MLSSSFCPPREKEIIDWRKKKKKSPNGSIGLK